MNPRSTALVLIEYQNDFTTPGGKLHDAVKPVMDTTNMLQNTVETVRQARAAGVTIVSMSHDEFLASLNASEAKPQEAQTIPA
jgi:ureidoacrylate peracid hydrolase